MEILKPATLILASTFAIFLSSGIALAQDTPSRI
jgi:hypothetical protein